MEVEDKVVYIIDKEPLKKITDPNDYNIIKNIVLFVLSSHSPEIICKEWNIDCNSSKSFYYLTFPFPKNTTFSLRELNSFYQISPLLIDDINLEISKNNQLQLNIILRKSSSSIHLTVNKIKIIRTSVMSSTQVDIIDNQEVQKVINGNKKRKHK